MRPATAYMPPAASSYPTLEDVHEITLERYTSILTIADVARLMELTPHSFEMEGGN